MTRILLICTEFFATNARMKVPGFIFHSSFFILPS
jgi:hypothetical protein